MNEPFISFDRDAAAILQTNPMKYEATLYRSETKTATVLADNRDAALKLVRDRNPGFTADLLVELGEDDEPGDNHSVEGTCENCEKTIWEGEKYYEDDDGIQLCQACAKACSDAHKKKAKRRGSNMSAIGTPLPRNYQRGEARHNTKLTAADVREIRRLGNPHSPERIKDEAIAAQFGVSEGNVGHILKRRTWKQVL